MPSTAAAQRPKLPHRIDRAPAGPTLRAFAKSHAASSARFVYLSAIAILFWAGWTQSDVQLATASSIVHSAILAFGLSVAVCGSLAVVLLWLININETRASLRHRLALQRFAAMRELGIMTESAATATPPKPAPRPARTRADAPHASGTDRTHGAWIDWRTFARRVNTEKSAARDRGRPFTLLHLRAVKPGYSAGARSIRLEAGHETTSKLQQLVNATIRPDDVASVSPAGDCFLLLPRTIDDVGRAFAGRLAQQVRPVVGEDRVVEIRQFTYVGSHKSEAMRVVGHPLAA